MAGTEYKVLSDYLQFIGKEFNMQFCINDFVGFLPPAGGDLAMQPFYIHSNVYCMYVKSHKELFIKCLDCKKDIIKKSASSKDIFFGRCFAGVCEYIIPVFYHQKVIAAISAGVYTTEKERFERTAKKISMRYGLDITTLKEKYSVAVSEGKPDIKTVADLLGIVSRLLESLYEGYLREKSAIDPKIKPGSNADYILNHALEYIKYNYHERIRISDLTKFCHCSESYFSHLFKSRMGYGINHYINHLRVEDAKKLLVDTKMSIKEIAIHIGFNDSNYFSKVFCDFCSVYPKDYRKNSR